ncbi:MAG: endolytic transglycosylase MltG [Chloroflexota bacterium]|nr:endolytic transglycosylase MltG [Chloroflexota bacterium]
MAEASAAEHAPVFPPTACMLVGLHTEELMKRRGSRGAIIVVLLLFVLIFGGAYYTWSTVSDIFQPVTTTGAARTIPVVIRSGETTPQIAYDLQASGLIRNALAFRVWARVKGLDKSLRPGVYKNLNTGMDISSIIDQLLVGQPDQLLVRVPEGWRIEQIVGQFEGAGLPKFDKQVFLNYVKNPASFPDFNKYPILKSIPSGGSMEGLLFPDTYFIAVDATPKDVIDKMLQEFLDKVQQYHLDTTAQANKLSVYQMVTLASIVERETPFDADRAKIASVYWNRINRPNDETVGLLQSDPTVEYARDSQPGTTKYWDSLNNSGTGTTVAPTSRWNTYTHKGWPPTPICSPGLASLQAAASPAKTDFYFFLGRPDTGRAVFEKTKAAFDQDVQKYLPHGG